MTLTPLISNRLARQSSRRLTDKIRILFFFLILNFCQLLSAVPGCLSGSSPRAGKVQQAKSMPAGFVNCEEEISLSPILLAGLKIKLT